MVGRGNSWSVRILKILTNWEKSGSGCRRTRWQMVGRGDTQAGARGGSWEGLHWCRGHPACEGAWFFPSRFHISFSTIDSLSLSISYKYSELQNFCPFNGQGGVKSQSFSLIFLVWSTPLKWEVKISGPKSHGFERLMLEVQNIKGGLCNGFISNSVQFDRDWVNLMTTGWNTKQNLFQEITQFLTDWDNLMLDREMSFNKNHPVYVHLMLFNAHLNLKMGQASFKETI